MTTTHTTRSSHIFDGYDPDPAASMSLHADAYTDPGWFELEQRAVFRATWQWICHGEKLRAPGSYVAADVAGMPVVAVRDMSGEVRAFYESIGRVTIEVRREVPGHVANRLQAALWREAIHLVLEGVASVDDVDTSVWAAPGLWWAAMGPTTLFHLGAGEGGWTSLCERYADSFNRWWDDLGSPRLDEVVAAELVSQLTASSGSSDTGPVAERRDALITAMLGATAALR